MVDRVFAHAVNTVKRIPRTAGASRPPLADRLLVLPARKFVDNSYMDYTNRPRRAMCPIW